MPKIKKVKMKKQEIERDHFAETIYGAYNDVKHNWQRYVIILSALIIIIMGITYYSNAQKEKNISAGEEFYNATQLYMAGNYKDALETFKMIQKSYYGTSASRKAEYYKGMCYLYGGELDNAVSSIRKYINSSSNNDILKANAYIDIAKIYQMKMKPDSSLIYLNRFVKKYPNSHLMPEAYLTLAGVYEMQMNIVNADKYYSYIIYRFPNTMYAERASLYRNMLNGAIEVMTQANLAVGNSGNVELK